MEICNMTQSDILDVKKIATRSWHSTYKGIIPIDVQNNFLDMAYSVELLQERLTTSPFYVAKIEDEVVGFANFSNKNENGAVELFAIYLNPSHQNRGIGSALLLHGCQQLQPHRIYVNVEAENEIGKHFYLAKGFKMIEEFDDNFDGHLLKTIRMVLDLKHLS